MDRHCEAVSDVLMGVGAERPKQSAHSGSCTNQGGNCSSGTNCR